MRQITWPVSRGVENNYNYVFKRSPTNGGFWSKMGKKLNLWCCDPQKARPCAEPRPLTYFRQNPCGRLGWRRFEKPQKRTNSRVNNLMHEIAHAQKRNPLSHLAEILQDSWYPRLNQVDKFWWRSVKVFRGGGGSNFGLSHWLWSSSLQHSRTATGIVCDTSNCVFLFFVWTSNTLCVCVFVCVLFTLTACILHYSSSVSVCLYVLHSVFLLSLCNLVHVIYLFTHYAEQRLVL